MTASGWLGLLGTFREGSQDGSRRYTEPVFAELVFDSCALECRPMSETKVAVSGPDCHRLQADKPFQGQPLKIVAKPFMITRRSRSGTSESAWDFSGS